MKAKKILGLALAGVLAVSSLTGCGSEGEGVKLDPSNPVSLTIWHYYNGAQQAAFETLVSEFNATEGKEKGIYVEETSQGSVADLEQAVTDALNEKVGADKLPDIFSTYADTAYSVQKSGKLADLSAYFTDDELSKYVDAYVQEGYINGDDELYVFPVAKSTEITMVDKTDWEPFAKATGCSFDDLKTMEGIVETAEKYYEWTDAQTPNVKNDGKAFYGRDSMSNYFVINMKQMGEDIFQVEDGKVTLNIEKDKIRRLWDNFYVPYVKGYFASFGKFRSDDVKTGEILAYTGSSSSSTYFPDAVMTGDEAREIDYQVLTAPVLKDGEQVNVQQGAGMAVTKSDEEHEYAASVFLKWFTKKENSLRFVCESGYLPVAKDANNMKAVDEIVGNNNLNVDPKTYSCLESILENFDNTQFYSPSCFENGFNTRKILDYSLSDKAMADREAAVKAMEGGADRNQVLEKYVSDKSFDAWYEEFSSQLTEAAGL